MLINVLAGFLRDPELAYGPGVVLKTVKEEWMDDTVLGE